MLALTFVTGIVDAVGYLGLDRIFTGNMTGNVVILGMGIAGEDSLSIAGPLIALCAYALGATVAGRLLLGLKACWKLSVTAIFAVMCAALLIIATVLAVVDVRGASAAGVAIAASIAGLMGAQAAAARTLAVAEMTTVVVTSTITAYASETLLGPSRHWLAHRRFWAVVTVFLGALVGALLMRIHIAVPIFLAAGIVLIVAVVGHFFWHRSA